MAGISVSAITGVPDVMSTYWAIPPKIAWTAWLMDITPEYVTHAMSRPEITADKSVSRMETRVNLGIIARFSYYYTSLGPYGIVNFCLDLILIVL